MANSPAWWRLRPVSAAALAVALGLTGAGAWATSVLVGDQEHRLLKERANEVSLVLETAVSGIATTFDEQGAVLRATDGSPSAFEQAAAATPASGSPPTFAWLRPAGAGGGFRVIAAAGSGLREGQVVTGPRVATLDRALRTGRLVTTPIIGGDRLLGFAVGPPAAPAGTVLYREAALGPVQPPRQAATAPFSELDVVLYVGARAVGRQVLVSTSHDLPLRGGVDTQYLTVGAERWLLAVKAKRPLVGTVAADAPWIAGAAGALGSLLVGIVIETAARRRDTALELYEAEHHVAETLQRSLLPQIPDLPGLDLAARYLASGEGQQVGGDWFDAFPISGGRVGLVIGDVIGHDLAAASAMAQIRATLRAYALDGEPPGVVVDRLDRLVDTFGLTQLVTVFYGVLEPPAADGSRLLRYTNAGHLPPLVRLPDGRVDALSGGGSVVIGAPIAAEHGQAEHVLHPGSVLVLFTDGLVEAPGRSLDDGLRQLAATVSAAGPVDAGTVSSQVLATLPSRRLRDDVALLTVRLTAPQAPAPEPTETVGNTSTTSG